jgi:hypothetical protein
VLLQRGRKMMTNEGEGGCDGKMIFERKNYDVVYQTNEAKKKEKVLTKSFLDD